MNMQQHHVHLLHSSSRGRIAEVLMPPLAQRLLWAQCFNAATTTAAEVVDERFCMHSTFTAFL